MVGKKKRVRAMKGKRVKAMGGKTMKGKRVKAMGGKTMKGKRVKARGGNKIQKLAGGGPAERGIGNLLTVLLAAAARKKGKPLTSGEKNTIKKKAAKDT